ncbi:TPA: hypothetical protein ACF3EV_001454 [Enterococcus faecium]
MEKFNLVLFNEEDKQLLVQKINQVLQIHNQNFTLSVVDVEQVLDGWVHALLDNHLIDFSLRNTLYLMQQTAKKNRMLKSEYLNIVETLQESFYYLHSIHQTEDEELWEIIWNLYEKFDGNLEYVQGYIEDFPGFKGDE